jgi:hypothetical protein
VENIIEVIYCKFVRWFLKEDTREDTATADSHDNLSIHSIDLCPVSVNVCCIICLLPTTAQKFEWWESSCQQRHVHDRI